MGPVHGSSLNKDKEDEVSKTTSENGNAKSDQPDDRKFLIPREHIKRNKKKQNQVITGKGASTGNVMGAPEPVRHLFVKRISKDTNDEDVFTMMEQNGFTVKELKCISHPQAQFKSYKLAVPRVELMYFWISYVFYCTDLLICVLTMTMTNSLFSDMSVHIT